MNRTIDALQELSARWHLVADQVQELWTLILLAQDEARADWHCAGCGSRLCLRIRTGDDPPPYQTRGEHT